MLSHGGGGLESQELIHELILKHFSNPILNRLEDAAVINTKSKLAFTTDSFTVSPIFFNGGDIGKLSIAGTVNDLSMMGARPLYLSASFIIEEGFLLSDLEKIIISMKAELDKSGAQIVTGDTKVVPKHAVDKIFINTSGIGEVVYDGLSSKNLNTGDVIIVSGTVGDHGACILAQREGIKLETSLESDCQSLWQLVKCLIDSGIKISAMRDPTRGGLAAVLNEWAAASKVEIEIIETAIPIKPEVFGICELLGLDAVTFASEGRMVIAVNIEDTQRTLEILKTHPLGRDASIIGSVKSKSGLGQLPHPQVILKSDYGTSRLMELPSGELLPRIC
ncbi:MAG: hydrogenase expression/formation protein HypE [Nitrospirae bacterium]|nr:hydrogenase expression/formation protein HypE [Nitrospirota bacterium]